MRHSWLALALLLEGSCTGPADESPVDSDADTDADTDSDSDTDTDSKQACGEIPPDVCDANVACHSIKGFPVVPDPNVTDGYCIDKDTLPVRIGCIDKDVDCKNGQQKWARPPGAPDDKCFAVLGSCVPRDYVDCVDSMEATAECATAP